MTLSIGALKRLVIKIGSSTLVDDRVGAVRAGWFKAFAQDVARLAARGQDIIIVSSGAIALGRRALGFQAHPLRLEESQAAAAVGQIALAHAWSEGLGREGLKVAQVLLTLSDTEERRRYLNARATLGTLLALKAVPVINENDTVATAEIRFGDNDRLAARVGVMMAADAVILLSDIAGLYTADPRANPNAALIPEVTRITPEIEALGGGVGSALGSGGMATKLMAARLCMDAGVHMVIASGQIEAPLRAIEGGGPATWFRAQASPAAARKRWIAGTLKPQGSLSIDAGAVRALATGASLLPAGVVEVDGRFDRGDCVRVLDAAGAEIARGLIAYPVDEAIRIKGRKTAEIEAILGFRGRDEMIHRDDLVLSGR